MDKLLIRNHLAVAPMEGLTGKVFRNLHAKLFGGADSYYIPFITPTVEPKFTDRQLREIAPENNAGVNAIPQLLSNRSADFIWAAKTLAELGYKEVNLNLGCPAGTVVAKNKGSGFLRHLDKLEIFLDEVFSADIPIDISVKTRLGWSEEGEFEDIVNLYNKYPVSLLIVHSRLKTDQYKGKAREHVLLSELNKIKAPLGVNGDLITLEDLRQANIKFSDPYMLMVGRALMADPALFRKAKGGEAALVEEIRNFSDRLFDAYAEAFQSRKNAMMRMKEYWFFQLNLFEGAQEISRPIFKSKNEEQFRAAINEIMDLEIREDAAFGWQKPL